MSPKLSLQASLLETKGKDFDSAIKTCFLAHEEQSVKNSFWNFSCKYTKKSETAMQTWEKH